MTPGSRPSQPPDLGRVPALRGRVGGAEVVLRLWGAPPGDPGADASALVAAWTDPEVARWTAVPPAATPADPATPSSAGGRGRAAVREVAARWIAGEGERRARGLALDLVVGAPDDGGRRVLGEVGLARFDDAGRAEIGFWLAPAGRGRGLATAAVTVLAEWALAPGGAAGPSETGHGKGLPGNESSHPAPASPARPPGDRGGLGLRRVWARTDPANDRAAAVLVRAGFTRRGEAGGPASEPAARSVVWTLDAASLRA